VNEKTYKANLEYHVLNTVAKCWAKWISRVGSGRPVENDGFSAWRQNKVAYCVPLLTSTTDHNHTGSPLHGGQFDKVMNLIIRNSQN